MVNIGYSDQGHEDWVKIIQSSKHKWNFLCSPGDIPTPALVGKVKDAIGNPKNTALDGFLVPGKYFSFGDHCHGAPWSISYMPRIINSRSNNHSIKVHSILTTLENTIAIGFTQDSYVLHQTHPTASSFMSSHIAYAMRVAEEDPYSAYKSSLKQIFRSNIHVFSKRLRMQLHALKIYHHMTCLFSLERMRKI